MMVVNELFRSRKAVIVITVMFASFGALYMGKAQWEQVSELIKWTLGTWLAAQGVEDAAKHISSRP
jgi:heme O synthase-like polyprenyltransferase